MVLVHNSQFSAAWNKYITYQLNDLDANHVIVKLTGNIINLQFDKILDATYIQFYKRFVLVHSLYLFKLWYDYFTFEEIKVIIMAPDSDFPLTHADKVAEHYLALTHMITEKHKHSILQRSVYESHLQSALFTFDQIQSSNTTASSSFLPLHDALTQVDRTATPADRKSATPSWELDNAKPTTTTKVNCTMCVALKEMGIHFIKFHQTPHHALNRTSTLSNLH